MNAFLLLLLIVLSFIVIFLLFQRKEMQQDRDIMVHELRAPLTSIKGAVELLEKGALAGEEERKMFVIIKDSTLRMLDEVGDILDAGKIEAGRLSLLKQSADINGLIMERIATFSFLAREKGVVILSELDKSIPRFDFDPARISQVVNNLFSNSIKFIADHNGQIKAETKLLKDQVLVQIRDNGEGIAKDEQTKLFTRYGQFAPQEAHKGTGLGLYISKGIVEAHGGKIWIESPVNIGLDEEVGRGTAVYFTLPIHG